MLHQADFHPPTAGVLRHGSICASRRRVAHAHHVNAVERDEDQHAILKGEAGRRNRLYRIADEILVAEYNFLSEDTHTPF